MVARVLEDRRVVDARLGDGEDLQAVQQVPTARDATWVQPVLVGEVAYRTMTPDRRLRHPSWRGLRPTLRQARIAYIRTVRRLDAALNHLGVAEVP